MNQKHCRGCPHMDFNEMSDEMYCELNDYELIRLRWHKQRPDWCPLVTGRQKGKQMDDLISRQALMKEFSDFVRKSNNSDFAQTPTWNDAVSLVGSAPTIEERKTGEWEVAIGYDPKRSFMCDQCHRMAYEPSAYCPNCGSYNGGGDE